jgi:hypothetical protein
LLIGSATSRVTVSVGPPAEKGTTKVMARSGYVWAKPGIVIADKARTASIVRFIKRFLRFRCRCTFTLATAQGQATLLGN